MVSKRVLAVGVVALGLLATTAVTAVVSGVAYNPINDLSARVRSLNVGVRLEDALFKEYGDLLFNTQPPTVESYVALGKDVNLVGLRNLLGEYEARVRTANDAGPVLVKRQFERRGLSLGNVTPLIKDGNFAGALVHFAAYGALGGTDRTPIPGLEQVAEAAFGGGVPINTDLGKNVAGGVSPITAPQGLELRFSDGMRAPFLMNSNTFGGTSYIAKSQ